MPEKNLSSHARVVDVGAGELANEVTLAEADLLRFARIYKDHLGNDKTLNSDPPWVCAYLENEPDPRWRP